VAGPYTNGNVMRNISRAVMEGNYLLARGFIPFVPHLTGFWDLLRGHDYEEWMRYDLEWLKSCDALLRMQGESSGADLEVQEAVRLGIPVFFNNSDLFEHFKGRS